VEPTIDYSSHTLYKQYSQKGHVTLSPIVGRREVQQSLLNQVRRSRQRIYLATAYFVIPRKVRRALKRAARRGVTVLLLLPGPISDHPSVRHMARRFYFGLLRHGVRIHEYQPRFLHCKMILCDDWASIGSSNIDRWNLRWNLEANQEILDPEFSRQLQAMFESDLEETQEITYEEWCQRKWYRRILEWFWGAVDRQLARLQPGNQRPNRDR
jgi:phosphatidylserine/phosphatidylglycerophosphate/cardiolipin synthase-like enzyme